MKTENRIELTQPGAPRRNLAERAAVASLALTRNGITPGDSSRRGLSGRTTVQLLAVLVTAGTLVGAIVFAQSAKEIRGASPYVLRVMHPIGYVAMILILSGVAVLQLGSRQGSAKVHAHRPTTSRPPDRLIFGSES